MFLLVAVTVFLLTYLANQQMDDHFREYVMTYTMMGIHTGTMPGMMGMPEQTFLASVHRSLIWVGAVILVVGLAASYLLARSITIPLRSLSKAVTEIQKGNYDQRVTIMVDDEVGKLGIAFNGMSEALMLNNQLRKQFLADIAHELKTPLAILQGNLEGMLEGVIDVSMKQLSSLYDETVHLNRMIKELRDLSLAEAGQLVLEKELIDINGLLIRVLNMLKPLADEKMITFKQNLQPIPEIMVDKGRINQVLYNLLTNALKFTPEYGVVEIETYTVHEKHHNWLAIDIKDNGIGIGEADLPFIFSHFYRVDKSRNRRSGGSGIGLAIVKQLIETHGGQVKVESRVGEGSRFIIYLPGEKK